MEIILKIYSSLDKLKFTYVIYIAGKVFSKLSFQLPDDVLQSIVKCKAGVVEFLLNNLRLKVLLLKRIQLQIERVIFRLS